VALAAEVGLDGGDVCTCPNAESCAKTRIFLFAPARNESAVRTSCVVWRPERNVYLFSPVIASEAAGPEM